MTTLLVVLIVSGAVFYSGSQIWKAVYTGRSKPKDDSCGGCGH